jgi:hypothetical protein
MPLAVAGKHPREPGSGSFELLSHGSGSRVLGFSGLTSHGFKLLGSTGAPQSLDFSPGRRSWRIRSSRVQWVFVDRVARVMGFAMESSKIAIKPSDFGFGSPESPLEPPFVGSVHCSTGRGFRLPALSLLISRSISLYFPLNLPESLSLFSLLLSLSLTLNLSMCSGG